MFTTNSRIKILLGINGRLVNLYIIDKGYQSFDMVISDYRYGNETKVIYGKIKNLYKRGMVVWMNEIVKLYIDKLKNNDSMHLIRSDGTVFSNMQTFLERVNTKDVIVYPSYYTRYSVFKRVLDSNTDNMQDFLDDFKFEFNPIFLKSALVDFADRLDASTIRKMKLYISTTTKFWAKYGQIPYIENDKIDII